MNLITSTDALKDFCHQVALEDHGGYITVDTEFQRVDTYWAQLCLIQIAGSQRHALIDPLAQDIDLSVLKSLFFDVSITKVFHAARQDLEIFYQLWGEIPQPLFDTQIAAMACGYGDSVGYAQLVSEIVRETIDKVHQLTDWSRRPLTPQQLTYALQDVTYLRLIYENLRERLAARQRLAWIEEETQILLNHQTYEDDPKQLWMRLKPRSKGVRYLAKLQAISIVRDQWARKRNVPRSRIVKDQILLEMASCSGDSPSVFNNLNGIAKNFSQTNEAQDFWQALKEAEQLPLEECPRLPARPQGFERLEPIMDLLRLHLKAVSTYQEVAAKLIATTDDLYDIAASDTPHCPAVQGWRYEIFGKEALALKKGEKGLTVRKGRVVLVDH